jgi:hypothetical protein
MINNKMRNKTYRTIPQSNIKIAEQGKTDILTHKYIALLIALQ